MLFDYEKYDDAVCLVSKDMQGIDQYIFDNGTKIQKWSEFVFHWDSSVSNKLTDYQGNDLGWFIVSSRFRTIIEELQGAGIQFLPIKIINNESNTVSMNYYAVNVYNCIEDAFDFEESRYIGMRPNFKEDVMSKNIRIYALKRQAIEKYHIFQIKEKWTTPIFVSEEFKRLVRKNKITGCDFGDVVLT